MSEITAANILFANKIRLYKEVQREMSSEYKVFTFNLRVDASVDGINRFGFRKGRILKAISDHSPDLIGFQEAGNSMRAWS